MSQDEIRLFCEGEPRGRDVRWFNLVLSHLAETFEPAAHVKVMPAGSKADLSATVRGARRAFNTSLVYAIRDSDFLRTELLAKDLNSGVYSLQRHCLESYLVEPRVLEGALRSTGMEDKLHTLAERRFWQDIGRAVLDAHGYEMRKSRLHLGDSLPLTKAQVTEIVRSKIAGFHGDVANMPFNVEAHVEMFEHDMRSGPLWTRVNGKELMRSLAEELGESALPGGDIEAALFKWCSKNVPPTPFVEEVQRILEAILQRG